MNKKNRLKPKKKFGQNFLKDQSILENIIDAAGLSKEDTVVEIGPGQGALSTHLAKGAKEVFCFEIDKGLSSILDKVEKDYENLEVIYEDFLKVDYPKFLDEKEIKSYKVVANLPYYITTAILMKLYDEGRDFESITVMVQKEVGQRLLAKEDSKDYGALTVLTRMVCDASLVCHVANTCFYPVPKVDSVVIKLSRNNNAGKIKDTALFRRLVKGAFYNRRKKMVNSILNSGLIGINKEELLGVLEKLEISPMIRGEKLSFEDFTVLSNEIYELKFA